MNAANRSILPERINQGASSCLKSFGSAINAISQQTHPRSATILSLVVDEQDRFTLWTSNIGVFVSANQSLDFRLRDVPDMVRLFLLQLENIVSSLEELQQSQFQDIPESTDVFEPFRSWATRGLVLELPEENLYGLEEPRQSTAKDLLEAVHESIEWLYRLSNMVRRASFVSQNRRAAKRELSLQAIEQLRERMDREIRDSLKNADPIDKNSPDSINESLAAILRKRLIETMLIRYSRISYRRDRVRDNKSYRLETVDPPSMEEYTRKHVSQDTVPEVPVLTVTEAPKQAFVVPERHRATTVDKSLLQEQSRPRPSQMLSSTPSRIEGIEQDYPVAPRVEEGHSFTCSFCCCILSATEGRGRAWRKHIERDLDHYICLFHPCPCPYELYSSRQDWLAHLSSQHRKQWVCTSFDHQKPEKFDEVESFTGHMQHCHPGSFLEDELATIVKACEEPADPIFEECPFNCMNDIREDLMEDHVEHHLRAIALRSLPDPDNDSIFGPLPSTHASTSSNKDTENEEHKVKRGTIYGSEAGSLPSWEPWPVATENSATFERGEDFSIPDTPANLFQSKDIPAMQNRRQHDDAIDQLNDKKLKSLAQQKYSEAERIQCKAAAEAERQMAAEQMRATRIKFLSPSITSGPPIGLGQRPQNDRDLETRIDDCLTGVLSNALLQCERRSGRIGPEEKSFFCRSDLEGIWSSEPRLVDIVFGHLSEGQRETLLTDLLLFISFLVKIEVRPRFILSCKDVFFRQPESTTLRFKDDDGPRSEADLLQMGLTPRQARSWKEQYRFRPAKITFAIERWEPQRIDPGIPLPFELTEAVHSGVMIHGGFLDDDTDYESQYGTARLYTIPREYIESEIRASETWEPRTDLLRIVKSFSARQNAIEEAKNMKILKQSLMTNPHISVHDAIIEQRQEEDTGIVSIVSPYASLGDLAQFLEGGYGIAGGQRDQIYDMAQQFPRASDTHQLRMSLLGQAKNLASALEFLHNGFTTKANDWKIKCAHLDLKPSNVLIFESTQTDEVVGHWKLSDFGISVFGAEHLQGSPTVELGSAGDFFNKLGRTFGTYPKLIPGVYQAPEIEHPDDNSDPEHGARTSDIWSFGAIFAEVLAYAHGGASGVKKFDQKRRRRTEINGELVHNDFFYTTMPEHMRRPSSTFPYILRREVSLWLEEVIFEHQPEPLSQGVCLRCWAECVKTIFEVDPHNRPSAGTLCQFIADLHRHAKDTTIPHLEFVGPDPRRPSPEELNVHGDMDPLLPPAIVAGSSTARRSYVTELPLSSRDVLDYDLDGKTLVYLTKMSIDLFIVDSPSPYSERLQTDHGWHGIKVAEPYVVVWGSEPSRGREPALRVYKMTNGQLSRAQSSSRIMDFDVTRRVAVSRQGILAVIHNNEILVLDANDAALKELSKIKMVVQYPVGKFVDIAFDFSGLKLYAWGNQDLYGALYAYEFRKDNHGIGEEIFQGRYKKAFSEHKALILPFDAYCECVIAVGPTPTSFFLGDIGGSRRNFSSPGTESFTSQKFSELPSGYYAWAGCTIRDTLLLVGATRKGLLSRRKVGLSEQVISADGRLRFSSESSKYPALEAKTPWSTLHNPDLNTDVKVGVIPPNGAAEEHSIVVCYKKGVIEVL